MKKRNPRPQGHCIFCNAPNVSKEHIWSDWLNELIPRRKMHTLGTEAFEFNRDKKEFGITRPMSREPKRGCLTQRKIRKVCETCNNEWMSRAVGNAKPIASELIQGRRRQCDNSELLKLTSWLSITIVMQEFIAPDAVYIPAGDRSIVMSSGLPPTDWTIWIGYYAGQLWYPIAHTHNVLKMADHKLNNVPGKPHIPTCNVQIATFSLRNLLVHAFTAAPPLDVVSEYRQFVRDANFNLFQLWPLAHTAMTWPRFPIFDAELDRLITEYTSVRWQYRADLGFRRNDGV